MTDMIRVFSEEERQNFRIAAEEAGLTWDMDIHVYPLYSGRYMYGEQCFGIVTPYIAKGYYMLGLFAKHHLDLSAEMMNNRQVDNMAKDHIIYFPGYLWIEAAVQKTAEL